MKVLLLAAGRGTRISRYLAGNPKCTVDIGGQKLIQYTIELFHKKGITDIAMVLGYRAEVIQETLKDYEGIHYFYKPMPFPVRPIGRMSRCGIPAVQHFRVCWAA